MFKCEGKGNPSREYAKPSLWERLTTKKLSTDKLVANPLDEFSMPHIGPSDRALSKHMKYIAENRKIDVTDGPIVVKKLNISILLMILKFWKRKRVNGDRELFYKCSF